MRAQGRLSCAKQEGFSERPVKLDDLKGRMLATSEDRELQTIMPALAEMRN